MKDLQKIIITSLVVVVGIFCSPFIIYSTFMFVWGIEYEIEDYFQEKAIKKATKSIQPLEVHDEVYDIKIVMFGIANSEFEYHYDGSKFVIDEVHYDMSSDIFSHLCSEYLYSYLGTDYDMQMIDAICGVINSYNLEYEFVEGYGYRGYYYGDCYVYGRYDEAYLNGQYLELSLRPTEGYSTVLRFDLELEPDSIEQQIISDLKKIDHKTEEQRLSSVENLLGLVKTVLTIR